MFSFYCFRVKENSCGESTDKVIPFLVYDRWKNDMSEISCKIALCQQLFVGKIRLSLVSKYNQKGIINI